MPATTKRPYRMTARADAVRETESRVLEAAIAVFLERPTDQISLDDVAARAGVTKQTVLRRFETKDRLLAAAAEREEQRVRGERGAVAPGDVRGAVSALVAHYERVGHGVLRMLAEEGRNPGVAAIADRGRAYHAEWCETVFAPALAGVNPAPRRRRLAQLIAITDVLTWKLLRHDGGLSRRETELALRELLAVAA